MGSQISRITRSASTPQLPAPPLAAAPPPSRSISEPTPTSAADLTSYEAACRADPDLRSFDSTLHLRTRRAINSIAVGAGAGAGAFSLDSLTQVTECLLESNHDVVEMILKNKRDIWKNKELSDLVDDYFENSLFTLDFCTSLDACLKRAGHIESIINVILRKFDEEHKSPTQNKTYPRTLDELRSFQISGDPFTTEFFKFFDSVHSKQILMLQRLQEKKRKLDKKLGKLKIWRKVSNVMFVVAFTSVLVCSVVAAAVTAPPVVVALAAAAAVPLGSMGKWINSIWKKWEGDVIGEREVVGSMQIGSYIVIKDLDNIRLLVERFRITIEGLLSNAEFAMKGEEAVVIAVEDIRRKVDGFVKVIRDLSDHAGKCTQETRMARTLILRRIMSYPKGGGSGGDFGMFS